MSGSTARTDVVGPGVTIDPGLVPGFAQARVAFLVDGVEVTPRVLAHRWDPDLTETVYALTDALRLTERRGILLALARVGFAGRFDRTWSAWAPVGACAWLDTFFRGVVCDGLADVGPLRVDDVPWKDEEISLGRDGPGGPARAT